MARLRPKCRLPVRAAEVCTSLPAEGNAATREHFTSELLFTPLALKDRCHNSSITYKQSPALHPGGKFSSLQIGQVTDKLYNSDAKPPISGPISSQEGGRGRFAAPEEPSPLLGEEIEGEVRGFCSVLLHLCVLLPKLGWKKVYPPKNAFELLVPGVFVPAWHPQAKISATVRKQNACKESQSGSVYFVSTSLHFPF